MPADRLDTGRMRERHPVPRRGRSHFVGCVDLHAECALAEALDEVDELRAALVSIAERAREFKHERDSDRDICETVDHALGKEGGPDGK